MCTLTLAWQVFEDAPLVVAANRDERVDRPSEPPEVRDWETQVIAPLDAKAGGTWLGYNEHGVLVAVTNRWTDGDLSGDRSRGLLVRNALRHESAENAVRYVERELDTRSYAGFNLVVADATAAVLVEWGGRRQIRHFDPGVHVVVNVGVDGAYTIPAHRSEAAQEQAANADAVRTALQPEPGEGSWEWLDRAVDVISDHEYGVCIHRDGFGTRSSSLVHVAENGVIYEYADGPPCRTAFERVESQI
ncbi:MAG: NRDE family protein [Haloarculaceae archaeon]